MVVSQTNIGSNVGQSNVTSGAKTDYSSYGTKENKGTVVIERVSGRKEYVKDGMLQRIVEPSGTIVTPVKPMKGGSQYTTGTSGDVGSKYAQAVEVNKSSGSSDVPKYEGASVEALLTGTSKQNPMGLMNQGYDTGRQSVYTPNLSQQQILTQSQNVSGSVQAQRIINQSNKTYTGNSIPSLLSGTSAFTSGEKTITQIGSKGYVDTQDKQSVYSPGITKEQVQILEQEKVTPQVLQKLEQQQRSGIFKGLEKGYGYVKKEIMLGTPKEFSKQVMQPLGQKVKDFNINLNQRLGTQEFISSADFFISKQEQAIKQTDFTKSKDVEALARFGVGAERELLGFAKEPSKFLILAGAGAGFKAGEVVIGEVLPLVVTGSKLFKYGGYVAGSTLVGYQGVVFAKDVKDLGFSEATGKLAVDIGTFSLGYKTAEGGINKFSDLIRTRGLEKKEAVEFFSGKTVEGETIKQGLATSKSFGSTIKQFEKGIKGEQGFVSTGSPKPLEGLQVKGGEKAGLEDLGLYVSPKGEAQPLFTRVQSGKEISTEYSINLFAQIGASKPTLTNIYGIEKVKVYPKSVLFEKGFQAASEYAQSQIGKGYVFPTKRSMIGQGVIKRQKFEVPYDVELGGKNIKAGSIRKEAGTSEAEAIIAVGEKFEKKPTKTYVELEGRRIVIEERSILKGKEFEKVNVKKFESTTKLKENIKKQQDEISKLSSKKSSPSYVGSLKSFNSNLSNEYELSSTSNLSSISKLSKVSNVSSTSELSILSKISNLSNKSNLSNVSRVSELSSLSNVSGLSKASSLSVVSGISKNSSISTIKYSYELPKFKLPFASSGKSVESFIVEIGKAGKTKVYEKKAFSGRYEAESYLKSKLKGTIAASGTIKTSSGESVMVNLGDQFTSGKKDKSRIVQKAKYRLSSAGEKQQIRSFKI